MILFGYHRIGYKILKELKRMKLKFIVVDYNPRVVLSLGDEGIDCIYGDAADKEFLRELSLDKVKMIISTIPDDDSNLSIRNRLKEIKSDATFIATTEQPRNALDLYKEGIDYVLVPQHLGGDYVAHMLEEYHLNKSLYKEAGKKHRKELSEARKDSRFE